MPILTDGEIDKFVKQAQKEEKKFRKMGGGPVPWPPKGPKSYLGPDGRSYPGKAPWSSEKRKTSKPQALYFYYLKFTDGKGVITRFVEQGLSGSISKDNDIDPMVSELIKSPPENELSIEGRQFKKHSYIAFFVDNSDWNLVDGKVISDKVAESHSLAFVEKKQGSKRSLRNNTFFCAENRTIVVGNRSVRYLLWENLHRHPNGNPRRRQSGTSKLEEDKYKFDVFYKIPIVGSKSKENLMMIVDPGGRNTGP